MIKIINRISLFVTIGIFFIFSNPSYAKVQLDKANSYIYQASIAMTKGERDYYIDKACTEYQKAYNEDILNLDAIIGYGKTLAYKGERAEAKTILMQGYNTNPENPKIQAALGDYNYIIQEYNNALEFYKLALSSGYLKDYRTNLSTANCYEKLGDTKNARLYYQITLMLNPGSIDAKKRLYKIDNMYQYNVNPDKPNIFDETEDDENTDINTIIEQCKDIK